MPNFLEWLDTYSVGVEELDQDHKKLVKLANAMLLAVNDRQGDDLLGEILAELLDFLTHHYRREEALMQKSGYPEFETHKAKHHQAEDKAFQFNDGYLKGTIEVVEFCYFLMDLVMDHLKDDDHRLGQFLTGQTGPPAGV